MGPAAGNGPGAKGSSVDLGGALSGAGRSLPSRAILASARTPGSGAVSRSVKSRGQLRGSPRGRGSANGGGGACGRTGARGRGGYAVAGAGRAPRRGAWARRGAPARRGARPRRRAASCDADGRRGGLGVRRSRPSAVGRGAVSAAATAAAGRIPRTDRPARSVDGRAALARCGTRAGALGLFGHRGAPIRWAPRPMTGTGWGWADACCGGPAGAQPSAGREPGQRAGQGGQRLGRHAGVRRGSAASRARCRSSRVRAEQRLGAQPHPQGARVVAEAVAAAARPGRQLPLQCHGIGDAASGQGRAQRVEVGVQMAAGVRRAAHGAGVGEGPVERRGQRAVHPGGGGGPGAYGLGFAERVGDGAGDRAGQRAAEAGQRVERRGPQRGAAVGGREAGQRGGPGRGHEGGPQVGQHHDLGGQHLGGAEHDRVVRIVQQVAARLVTDDPQPLLGRRLADLVQLLGRRAGAGRIVGDGEHQDARAVAVHPGPPDGLQQRERVGHAAGFGGHGREVHRPPEQPGGRRVPLASRAAAAPRRRRPRRTARGAGSAPPGRRAPGRGR